LQGVIADAERNQADLSDFFQRDSASLRAASLGEAQAFWTAMAKPSSYVVSSSAISGVINSAKLNLIESGAIRASLQRLALQFTEIDERSASVALMEIRSHELLAQHASYQARSLELPTDDRFDLSTYREDVSITAQAAAMRTLRSLHIRELERLQGYYAQLAANIEAYTR